jgi:hypothetical protein
LKNSAPTFERSITNDRKIWVTSVNNSLNIGLLSTRTLAIIFYRFVMVVRKNVLEYIIALVVVKNKVRLKKCLKKFQI